jgi:hypothetical protein
MLSPTFATNTTSTLDWQKMEEVTGLHNTLAWLRGIELEFLEGGCLTSVLKGLQYDDEDLETRLLWVS